MERMTATNWVSFDAELGRCGLRWSGAGITSVYLPGSPTIAGLAGDDEVDLPPFVMRAIAGIVTVMAGGADDLRDIPIDHRDADEFRRSVYAATREIPAGSTRSYGEIARAMGLGPPDGARDVGAALARNPTPIIVPCHRVVAANGALHGFSAPGGLEMKRRMLELEGAPGYGQQALFG